MFLPPTTERLRLRRFLPNDADHLASLDADPLVLANFPGMVPGSADEQRRVIEERIIPRSTEDDGLGLFAADALDDGRFVGWFAFRPGKHYKFADEAGWGEGDVEIGYRLRSEDWNQGFATEGSRALVALAPTVPGLRRVVGIALERNIPSRRVLVKAGLNSEREGIVLHLPEPHLAASYARAIVPK